MLKTKLEQHGCCAPNAPAAKDSWAGCSTKQGLLSRCMMHVMLSDSDGDNTKGTEVSTLDRHYQWSGCRSDLRGLKCRFETKHNVSAPATIHTSRAWSMKCCICLACVTEDKGDTETDFDFDKQGEIACLRNSSLLLMYLGLFL
jgi:hypothetical protein